jgi:hypothetical protein
MSNEIQQPKKLDRPMSEVDENTSTQPAASAASAPVQQTAPVQTQNAQSVSAVQNGGATQSANGVQPAGGMQAQGAQSATAVQPTAAAENGGAVESKPATASGEQKTEEKPKAAVQEQAEQPIDPDKDPNFTGLNQQIDLIRRTAEKNKEETDEQRAKREKKEKRDRMWAAIGDGLQSLSNLFFTTQYAPNMYNHQTMSQQTPLQERLEREKKEREANGDKYLNYSMKLGDLYNQRAKTVRELEAQRAAQKLAREKAQREQEEHDHKKKMWPDEEREQTGKANTAENKATTAKAEADEAPEYFKAKTATEKAKGAAQRAAATNSYASAAAHDRSNPKEFEAWDEKNRGRKFSTKKAADNYAMQHGTYKTNKVTSTSKTDSEENGNSTTTTTSVQGYAGRPTKPVQKPAGKHSNFSIHKK